MLHSYPPSMLTPDEVGQLGSLHRMLVVRNSGTEPMGGDFWCWKLLQTLWLGYAQEERVEESWSLGEERGSKERVRLFCTCGGEREREVDSP